MTSAIRAQRDAESGFTLIELLVVVIIIGILAAIAIPAFLNQRESAYQAAAESEARNAALSVEAEFTKTDSYPADNTAFAALADVNPGPNVTLTYSLIAANEFSVAASHALLDADGDGLLTDADALYCSADGGLQTAGTESCP